MKKLRCNLIYFIMANIQIAIGQPTIDSTTFQNINVINEAAINTANIEFSPGTYKDFITIVRANQSAERDENIDDYYFDLVYIAKNANGILERQAFFPPSINFPMHEGPAAFDASRSKLYFSRCYVDLNSNHSTDTIVNKLFEASESDYFSSAKELPFNSQHYSIVHPTLSLNGNKMIFASDMDGNAKMDLYSIEKNGDGWSDISPISNKINTKYNEVFPYLYKDSLLFFATDRPDNNGGLDIMYATLLDTGWTKPKFLPYPINSSFDDYGLLISNDEMIGFFSSNRPGGIGKDDIYRFESKLPIIKKWTANENYYCTINPIDKLSFLPIENGEVIINKMNLESSINNDAPDFEVSNNIDNGEIFMKIKPKIETRDTLNTGISGSVTYSISPKSTYLITIKKKGYQDQSLIYKPAKHGKEITMVLNPLEEKKSENIKPENNREVVIPNEVGATIIFNNIFYEYNSIDIKIDAANELDQLYFAMINRPTMKVQLAAHTDSRGNSIYNKQLSENRALSAKHYLVTRGISSDRIVTLGFGESRIRNQCIDGVTCTEEEHLFNRRTEVMILEK